MKEKVDVAGLIHKAEIVWILAWLVLGIVVLIGLNSNFTTSRGEQNTWQIVFGFLP
ncbi:MAG: hypothetical protein HY075_08430 [Deltaproteobacteria bacterium]|nr:hypothetical protein [Deltaproteobacteria bacterium]